ncbi:MAG: NAD(P)H-binding protein [Gemmatimonadota bacterium]|jgi:uncharacterized protein YbjT (DUF2867 family)
MKKALVLGGTGMLGAPVVRRLVADGFAVRVLARDPRAARSKLADVAERIEVAGGDAADPLAVREAAMGCGLLHVSVGPPVDRITTEIAARVAADVGAERLGYVSGTTVSEDHRWFPMIDEKLAAERAVEESGVPWTIFRPSWPFEQLPRFARGGEPFLLGEIPHRWHWFAGDDMGRMVSAAYQRPAAARKRLTIHGPEALTLREALERYCATVHPDAPPIKVMPLWLARLMGTVTRNAQLRAGARLMAYFVKVGEGGDPSETNDMVGPPTTTLDAWLEERMGVPA